MKKVLLGAVGVIVVLIVIGALAGDSEPQKVDRSSGGQAIEQTTAGDSEQTQTTFQIGETIEMGDITLTVNNKEVSQGGQFTSPSEGNEWINLNLTIENTGSDQEYITTLGQMYIVDGEGNQYSTAVTSKSIEKPNNSLDGAVVAKAKKTGWVGFEVPKTAENLTFRYNASFWNDNAILVESLLGIHSPQLAALPFELE